MSEIYGIKVAKDLVHIQGDTSDYHLEGFVAKPEHSRSNKHYISILSMDDILRILYLIKLLLKVSYITDNRTLPDMLFKHRNGSYISRCECPSN